MNGKLIVFGLVLVVGTFIFYGYTQNFWMTENQQPKITMTGTVASPVTRTCSSPNEYNATGMLNDNIFHYCESKHYIYSGYVAINTSTRILHTTIAKVLEFKDSDKRELITMANTKFVLDNFTNPMHIGDIVKIDEIYHHPTSCEATQALLYNGTVLRGSQMDSLKNSTLLNWSSALQGYKTPCFDYTTFSEVPAN